jgi:hypothetical protein
MERAALLNNMLFSSLQNKEKEKENCKRSGPGFLVRLELHHVDGKGYDAIYRELHALGFHVQISADAGKVFKLLPTTLYRMDLNREMTATKIHDLVKKTIDSALDEHQKQNMTKQPSILVARTEDVVWSGLDEIQ